MNKKKNNNSVLLITTLGVYIGLLMVGATPGIVEQQAAMTRTFEISEEVEVKDDLDLEPKDQKAGFDERELDTLIASSSVRSIVQVYLSQFAVDSAATDSSYFSDFYELESGLTAHCSNRVSFWPNEVLESSSRSISSLPRAAIDTALANAT